MSVCSHRVQMFADGFSCFLAFAVLSGVAAVTPVAATDSDGDGPTDTTENDLGSAPNDLDTDGNRIADNVETTRPKSDLNAAIVPAINESNSVLNRHEVKTKVITK
ncbi:hypothetical protein EXE46_11755 [Halorubrum sp. GN11_10-6_MGM]|uniref:hypothetical protein n=1 Tax=Halorubrum sp. GN11_10-6_MGM TaxID=2518112 RepID=UPI0010F96671|nr:hypothetical protein [Halorubrum sp. GN11_10-6_MGM]TKX73917.1 hypothetical protein EXE46_11755 [Halorubrum sp. GN11_10-6_MGM]